MTPAKLSDASRRFLIEEIGSVQRLDLLLFLYRHPTKWWSAHTLTDNLQMPLDVVQSELEVLGARNLLDVRIAHAVIYCYHPARAELSGLVEEIAQAHFLRRNEVVTLLNLPTGTSARLFAEAFRLRKGTKNG